MPMNDVERNIRFGTLTVNDTNAIRFHYEKLLLESLKQSPTFISNKRS